MTSEQTSENEFITPTVAKATRVTIQTMATAGTSRPDIMGPKMSGPIMKQHTVERSTKCKGTKCMIHLV